jgi:hypothetical protein
MVRTAPWPARVTWLLVALAAIPALSDALQGRSALVGAIMTTEGWVLWSVGFVATLVPRTASLTVYRLLAPLSVVTAIGATVAGARLGPALVFVAVGVLATTVALAGVTTDAFVDGSSYGSERRFGLRVPPLLALGPVPLSWLVMAAAALVPVLAAARQWPAAFLAAVVAGAGGRFALRALHQLSRRWIVFVPAGMVLHDPLVLADAVLIPRRAITRLGPALADTDATDLTQQALGLAVEAHLAEPLGLSLRTGRGRQAEEVRTDRFLVAPLRPGALLAAAAEAKVAVG